MVRQVVHGIEKLLGRTVTREASKNSIRVEVVASLSGLIGSLLAWVAWFRFALSGSLPWLQVTVGGLILGALAVGAILVAGRVRNSDRRITRLWLVVPSVSMAALLVVGMIIARDNPLLALVPTFVLFAVPIGMWIVLWGILHHFGCRRLRRS